MDRQQTLLIVDDDIAIRRFLRITLEANGYRVCEAETGRGALEAVAREQPGAVLLDLGLPDIDGQRVIGDLRQWSDVPIVVLSVRGAEADKVAALDGGAHDYVTKPFATNELLARIRALLRARRDGPNASTQIAVGGLEIDVPERRVLVDGQEVKLTRKEFDLLHYLAGNAGRIVTHQQLLGELWGKAHLDATHYLRVHVGHLRKKLGDNPLQPRFIQNEPGIGYRLQVPAEDTS